MKAVATLVPVLLLGLAGTTWSQTQIPSPDCGGAPGVLTITPDGSVPYRVTAFGVKSCTPVSGATVEVEFSPEADALIAWGEGQQHPLLTQLSNASGEATFYIRGAGCIDPDVFYGNTFIVQVRVDGIVVNEPFVNSPDVVNGMGLRPTDLDGPICESGLTTVGLADAVYHTPPIKLGLVNYCSKFSGNYWDPIDLEDAIFLTPYLKTGVTMTCAQP